MRCIVKKYSDISSKAWNDFVYKNSMGWAYFLYDVVAIDQNSSFENLSFAIFDEDNDEIIMLCQLHKTNNHPIMSKFYLAKEKLVSRWGYVLKDGLSKKQINNVKQVWTDYIDDCIKRYCIKEFNISLPPLSIFSLSNNTPINPLMVFNFEPKIRYTYLVDLSKSDKEMLADCEETTRQAIRKISLCQEYKVVEALPNNEDCQRFIRLHKETYIRTNAQDSIINDKYHENIFFKLIPAGVCRVFFLKNVELNKIISAVAILVYKNTAYYWWGCSSNDKSVGVNKFLLFKVMEIVRESFNKTGWFETGGAYPYLRKGKYKGLNDFKKCFGTILRPIFTGKYSRK